MVQNIDHDHACLEIEALRNLDGLSDTKIQAPIRKASQNAPAAVALIDTQNRLADVVKHRCRVSEQVGAEARGADAARASNVIVHSRTGNWANGNSILRISIREEVDGITFAEGLAASVDGAESDRQAARGSKDGPEGPAAEGMPHNSLLRFVEW